jgi:LacI family transcriptional regulator, galactose operon repressor
MPRTSNRAAVAYSAVTIRDVAAKAGVSVATVSRVFNQKGPIREDTIRKVMDVASAMQYVPHAGARSLSTRSTRTLGVLLPDLHGEFFSEMIRGVDVAARQRGFHILVSGSHSDAEEMSAMLRALRGRVDGLIVMSPDLGLGPISRALAPDTPVALLNCAATGRRTIRIDNYNGAHAMADHLLSLGHQRIAFITGPERNADAVERRRGYREALEAGGGKAIEIAGDFTEDSGHRAVPKILALRARPTAIFAANDAMAIGAFRALREARMRVPEDLALAGFDDVPIARYLTPPLTTVHVEIAEMGRRAVDYLVNTIENAGDGSRKHDVVATTLVVRESCGSQLPAKSVSHQIKLKRSK